MRELTTEEREETMKKTGRERQKHDEEIRARSECLECGEDVPEEDFKTKYASAGGILKGPFCSSGCYWGWMA